MEIQRLRLSVDATLFIKEHFASVVNKKNIDIKVSLPSFVTVYRGCLEAGGIFLIPYFSVQCEQTWDRGQTY